VESEKPFNPPAFPCEAQGNRSVPPEHDHLQTGIHSSKFPGMTLRDYFAGQALAGILSDAEPLGDFTPEEIAAEVKQGAEFCYLCADAMLAARNA